MNKNNKTKTAEKKTKGRKTGFLSILLLIVFLCSLGTCGYLLYGEINKELGIKDMEDNIHTFIKTSDSNMEQSDKPDNTSEPVEDNKTDASNTANTVTDPAAIIDWEGLMEQSEYVIGWIQMPGIDRINYPIVQNTDNNQFFLTHDWTGAYQSAGAIFLNRYNSSDFSDMNSIIYGHRMKAGSMFGLLKYYEKQSFMDENPYFYIYTPDGRKLTYDVVCCSHVIDGSDAYLQHFESPDERMAYYNMMIYNAVAKRDIELDRFDTTVMLSTCNSSAGYYERVTLLGKLTAIDLNGQTEN